MRAFKASALWVRTAEGGARCSGRGGGPAHAGARGPPAHLAVPPTGGLSGGAWGRRPRSAGAAFARNQGQGPGSRASSGGSDASWGEPPRKGKNLSQDPRSNSLYEARLSPNLSLWAAPAS